MDLTTDETIGIYSAAQTSDNYRTIFCPKPTTVQLDPQSHALITATFTHLGAKTIFFGTR